MKSVFRKFISLLLCAALLVTPFGVLGIISSAQEGFSQIVDYAELDGLFEDFVYVGTEIYETDYEGYERSLTDYYVQPGDWLEIRTYIKSDHYIGTSNIFSLFSNDFFDVRIPSDGMIPDSSGYVASEVLENVNRQNYSVDQNGISALVTSSPATASKFTWMSRFAGMDSYYLEEYDVINVQTKNDLSVNNLAYHFETDEWVYSYRIQVREDVTQGERGYISSPEALWQTSINESTGQYDTRRQSTVAVSPESIKSLNNIPLSSSCSNIALLMNNGLALNVLIDDMNHEFTIGENPEQEMRYTLTLDANGGCFDSGEYRVVRQFIAGEEIPYLSYPTRPGYIFMGWSDDSGEITYLPNRMPAGDVRFFAVWESCEYELCFDANGGWFNYYDTDVVRYTCQSDTQILFPESPERVGYTFAGWSSDSGASEPEEISDKMPYENVRYYAVWYANDATEYTVEYYYMNTDGFYDELPTETVKYQGMTGSVATQLYYECVGFTVDPYLGNPEDVIHGDGSTLLKVYLERNKYTVFFDANEGICPDGAGEVIFEILYGAPLAIFETPVREGYRFYGWSPEIPETMPATDLHFVAMWIPDAYVAQWYSDGDLFLESEFEYGSYLQAPYDFPVKEGYVFAGWAYEQGSDILADIENMTMPIGGITFHAVFIPCDDTPYTVETYMMNIEGEYELTETKVLTGTSDAEAYVVPDEYYGFVFNEYRSITSGPIFADGSLLLCIYYDREEYTVEFDTGFDIVTERYYFGSELPEPFIPEKEGYDFGGWVDNEGNFAEFPYIIDRDVRFTAMWYISEYVVHYDAYGGLFPDGQNEKEEIYYFGDEIRISEEPEKEGYVFAGWIDAETGEEVSVPMQMPDRDLNLCALWEAKAYTLYFDDGNGNTIGIFEMYYGDTVIFFVEEPEKYGFTFMGWMNEYGEICYEGFPMPACDLRLTAGWARNAYTVTWIDDGELVHEEVIDFDCVFSHPSPQYKKGYLFEGWAGPDGRVYSEGSSFVMPGEDIVFNAVYIPETDTPYRVDVYEMDSDGCYPTEPTYMHSFVGETDCVAFVNIENYVKEGFTADLANSVIEGVIQPDGSTVLEIYLARNIYELTIDTGDYVETIHYYYGSTVTEPYYPYKEGYYFDGWRGYGDNYVHFPFRMPAESITLYANWIPAEYTITFDAAGGAFHNGTSRKSFIGLYGDSVEIPEIPTREGFTFVGWAENGSYDIIEIPEYMPAYDMELTAVWEINVYRITFLDGFGNIYHEIDFCYGDDTRDILYNVTAPFMEGYTFIRWLNEETNSGYMPSTMPAHNLTYTAQWERNMFDIEWINDGEVWGRITCEYGAVIEAPADPLKEGYTFMGWFDSEGNPADFHFVAERNMTFYAQWSPNEYTLTFFAEGGEFHGGEHEINLTLRCGEEVFVPDYPNREGCYFVGWSTEPNSPYLALIPETMPAHDLVLYAVWQTGEFILSFDDGFGDNFLSINMDYGEDLSIVEYISCPKPDSGYVFSHWIDESTGEPFELPATMPSYNLTLVAVWDYSDYVVSFDFNGGFDSYGNYAVDMIFRGGDLVEYETPFREGYTFVGWEDGYGNRVEMPMIMPYEDINLYAVWECEMYRITYLDGFGSVWLVEEYLYGEAIRFPEMPVMEGYTFAGWYSDYGYDYPLTMPAQNIVLRAEWTLNQYAIRWIIDGEALEYVYEFGQEIVPPPYPEKQGYIFAGWDQAVPDRMPAQDLEFVALWEVSGPVTYKIETYTMNTSGTYDKSTVSHSIEKFGEVSVNPVIPEGFELNEKRSILTGYTDAENELVLKIYIDRQSFFFTKVINGDPSTTKYFYGSVINVPVTPELGGHIFTGWEPQVPHTMPAHDVTVTATFREMTPDESANAEIIFYITSLKNVTLNYGESITMSAYTKNLPSGYSIKWSVDTGNVTIKPSSNGRTCTVTSVASGGAAISAWVVDENGKTVTNKDGELLKDTEILYSEANTWLMIIAFFKKLFGFKF